METRGIAYEKSAGAVIFYQDTSKLLFLLLRYGKGHWDFPKGHIEDQEDEKDTVRREVREETGIEDIEILPDFRKTIQYKYRKDKLLVRKEVVFYLGRAKTLNVVLSPEHRDYAWLSYERALERLTFETARQTLIDAHKALAAKLGLQT
ncbi:Diadenosine hexaphosphate hydrolase [archaeon HR01]|nr:Diadenosine hexaphosphate hydrolase [archaeon HR01]